MLSPEERERLSHHFLFSPQLKMFVLMVLLGSTRPASLSPQETQDFVNSLANPTQMCTEDPNGNFLHVLVNVPYVDENGKPMVFQVRPAAKPIAKFLP